MTNYSELFMQLVASNKKMQDALKQLAEAMRIYGASMEEERQLQLKKAEELRLKKARDEEWQRQQEEQERYDFFYDDDDDYPCAFNG
jgi:predicted Rossmann fold nucleotide-binding protein DprA/Smf involved in DNA uptake